MITHIQINEKSFGDLSLYQGLDIRINAGEKIGLLGRNGTGKSTLFSILTGEDTDFDGSIQLKKGLVVVAARQEHQEYESTTVLNYILSDLPEFSKLKRAIETLPEKIDEHPHLLQRYTDAIERFGSLGYYDVENDVVKALVSYQLGEDTVHTKLGELSGGQRRLVELIKVQRARADLALIDEPTNHMDYVAKADFISWLKSTQETVIVISHDRDVLKNVDRIIELRDGQADICNGNYDDYLKINTSRMTSQVNEYSVTQRRITNLEADALRFQRLKEKARNPGTISRFKSQEHRARAELKQLKELDKPSFWIDKDSAAGLKTNMAEAYDEHKTRTIQIRTRSKSSKSNKLLIDLKQLSLGYDAPLFAGLDLQIREGDRLRIHGRNGVGKSTLVQAILAAHKQADATANIYEGRIEFDPTTSIGVYDQELSSEYLPMKLSDAIEYAYAAKHLQANDQKTKQLLNDYLFNPVVDGAKPLSILSGGQKARFQLMNMLAGDPNVLILDEPTNHLDLPSIEELENALAQYHGAIIYISHDSYFTKNIGGRTLKL